MRSREALVLNFGQILESRFPRFVTRNQSSAAALGKGLRLLFCENRFQRFEQDYPHLFGFDFVEAVLWYFDLNIRLGEFERARIPDDGRAIIIANHTIGSLDGIALLNLVWQVRPDVKVVANKLLMAVKPRQPVLLHPSGCREIPGYEGRS
jgi:1-acyl-sn-glycerol-3-phosphate acyltransferase